MDSGAPILVSGLTPTINSSLWFWEMFVLLQDSVSFKETSYGARQDAGPWKELDS